MNKSNDDSPFPQSHDESSPMSGYVHLTAHADRRAFECRVAQRILAWLKTTDTPYYRDYVSLVTEDTFGSTFMSDLAFGIWRHMDASMWLSWQDAPGSSCLLWQYAILRAAQQINA